MEYSIRINKFNTNKLNSITIKKCSARHSFEWGKLYITLYFTLLLICLTKNCQKQNGNNID